MCPICLGATNPATDVTLNCGGNHVLHLVCLQQLAAQFGGAVATGDQGPRGSVINYVTLPVCPLCRGRFNLAPNVADPQGLDNFLNNNPVAPPSLYYYDATQGLSPAEVQTYVIDAAQQALDDVNDLAGEDDSDTGTDTSEAEDTDDEGMSVDGGDDEDQQQVDAPTSLGFHICSECAQQAEFIVYTSGTEYQDEHPDDQFVPCPQCNHDIAADDVNVTACMACWVAWHQGC
jgi:uncharacterized CHY-type Zn-finger protein